MYIKKFQVFLASSEELNQERVAFGNFIRRLDDIYEKRGIRIKLAPWEDSDAAYNNRRKQDEYNEIVRSSDMFLAVFHIKAGKFTIEEFDVAIKEFERTGIKPKTYVYYKELKEGEQESEELKEFKRRLSDDLQYYWMHYSNSDSLHLHFVMQLQLVENGHLDNLVVENGDVTLEGSSIVHIDNLQFVASNNDYQIMSRRLLELPAIIEKTRLSIEQSPDNKYLQELLQNLLDEKNEIKKEIEQQQNILFDTAKRIATIQREDITECLKKAIEAFERGNVQEANHILDEAENDRDIRFASFEKKEELRNKEIQNIHADIETLLFQAKIIIADARIPIQRRIDKTIECFKKAYTRSMRTNYDKKKYLQLLFDYGDFLYKYGIYNDSENIFLQYIKLLKELNEEKKAMIALAYSKIGAVYDCMKNYKKALKYHKYALRLRIKALGRFDLITADSYIHIGIVLSEMNRNITAIRSFYKALRIRKKVLGKGNPDLSRDYNNLGWLLCIQDMYKKALLNLNNAKELLDCMDEVIAPYIYNNIGFALIGVCQYEEALSYLNKSIEIREKNLGIKHPDTVESYINLGYLFEKMKNDEMSIKFYKKALNLPAKFIKPIHHCIRNSYNWNKLTSELGERESFTYLERNWL